MPAARALALALVSLLLAVAPASAAVKAKLAISGSRFVVTVTGAKPKAVTVMAAGKSYKLTKSGSKWRSKPIANIASLRGSNVKVRVRSASGTKTLTRKVPGTPPTVGGIEPITAEPLFPPPAAPTTGNAAYEEIKGYFADSRFTDCPDGWPACAVEERYSHFANGDHYYCRLTPTSGSDIRSYGSIIQISGAEHKADGSWGVEYYLSSYGNTTFYSWSVSPTGLTSGRYWGPGRDPSSGGPDEVVEGLQWVRGARDCST